MGDISYSRLQIHDWITRQVGKAGAQKIARAALLAVPWLNIEKHSASAVDYEAEVLALWTFRAASLSWSSSFGGHRKIAASAAVAAAADANARVVSDTAACLCYSAAHIANAFAADSADAFAAARKASDILWSVASLSVANDDAIWRTIKSDPAIEELNSVISKAIPTLESAVPLFSEIAQEWQTLKAWLLARDQNWSFWVNWYEDRLSGYPQDAAFDRALLSLSRADWNQQPAYVNGRLVELLRELKHDDEIVASRYNQDTPPPVPEQDSRGARLVVASDGVIDFDASALSTSFLNDKAVHALHQQLLTQLVALTEKCTTNLTKSRLSPVLVEFGFALPRSLDALAQESAQVALWTAGLRLRALASAERSAFASRDVDYGWIDPPHLIDQIEALVAVYNVFNASLPRGAAFDENSRNPEPVRPGEDWQKIALAFANIENDRSAVRPRVAEANQSLDEIAKGSGPVADGARDAVKRNRRNLLITAAGVIMAGLATAATIGDGIGAIGNLITWLNTNSDAILAFVRTCGDELLKALEWLLARLPK